MSWADCYVVDPMVDLRGEPERARVLAQELEREVGPGHALHERHAVVVAEVAPQDEVLVEAGDVVFLVHLTWSGRTEEAPWPLAHRVDSPSDFEDLVEFRY